MPIIEQNIYQNRTVGIPAFFLQPDFQQIINWHFFSSIFDPDINRAGHRNKIACNIYKPGASL